MTVMPRIVSTALTGSTMLLLGCPTPVDDDDTGAETGSAPTSSSASGGDSLSASETSNSDGNTSIADSSTGAPSCDPATCESLDLETCEACPGSDIGEGCTLLYGWLWTEQQEGEWCTGQSVALGCQPVGICFDYSPTACDDAGVRYYLDNICPDIDFETLGLELCEPPTRAASMCPAEFMPAP